MYALAIIEDPRNGRRYQYGDELPDDLPGLRDVDEGHPLESVSETAPPQKIENAVPDEIEIDGVRYVQAGDAGASEEQSR